MAALLSKLSRRTLYLLLLQHLKEKKNHLQVHNHKTPSLILDRNVFECSAEKQCQQKNKNAMLAKIL